jgi:hypothetical protein
MNDRTDIRWLLVGAMIGLVAAGYGILRQTDPAADLPDGAIAAVNDTLIGRDAYQRALARLPVQDRLASTRLIEQMVDDELLVQRGIALGMTTTDLTVRAAIINSLIASVTAEADAASPSDDTLERHLAENTERFSFTARLHVEVWQTDVEPVAQAFVTALRDTGTASENDDIRAMPDLPAGLVDIEMLRNYLGPAITAAAAEMPVGSSALFARRGRWLVIRVVDKQREAVSDLASIRNRVLLDYRRTLADDMLREYLDDLRQRAEVRIAAP